MQKSKEKLDSLRKTHFEASKFDPYWQRYGLFSYPGTLAVADDTYPTQEKGLLLRQETDKKNIVTRKANKGFHKDAFFSSPRYQENAFEDYLPNRDKEQAYDMYKFHGRAWLPGGRKANLSPPYEYGIQGTAGDMAMTATGGFRGGHLKGAGVKTGRAQSSLTGTFGKIPEHISDPYDNGEVMRRRERAK